MSRRFLEGEKGRALILLGSTQLGSGGQGNVEDTQNIERVEGNGRKWWEEERKGKLEEEKECWTIVTFILITSMTIAVSEGVTKCIWDKWEENGESKTRRRRRRSIVVEGMDWGEEAATATTTKTVNGPFFLAEKLDSLASSPLGSSRTLHTWPGKCRVGSCCCDGAVAESENQKNQFFVWRLAAFIVVARLLLLRLPGAELRLM